MTVTFNAMHKDLATRAVTTGVQQGELRELVGNDAFERRVTGNLFVHDRFNKPTNLIRLPDLAIDMFIATVRESGERSAAFCDELELVLNAARARALLAVPPPKNKWGY